MLILFVSHNFPLILYLLPIFFEFWHQFILFKSIISFILYLTSASKFVILIVAKMILKKLLVRLFNSELCTSFLNFGATNIRSYETLPLYASLANSVKVIVDDNSAAFCVEKDLYIETSLSSLTIL